MNGARHGEMRQGETRNVLAVGRIHPAGIDKLAAAPGVSVTEIEQEAQALADAIGAADAVIVRTARIDRSLIARANRLQIVARHGVGFDAVDVAALGERRIPLATVGDANARTVAEHTLYLMLAAAKRGLEFDRLTRAGEWQGDGGVVGRDLYGKTAVIVGQGRVGRLVVGLCRAFGMRVRVFDPHVDAARISALGGEPLPRLADGLADADYLTLHAPLDDATARIIDRETLAALPREATVVNASRGGLVDEAALIDALWDGEVGAAALDVFEREPPAPDNPLFGLPNTVLTPHVAGLTVECAERMSLRCADNVLDFFAGRLDPAVVVNPEVLAPGG